MKAKVLQGAGTYKEVLPKLGSVNHDNEIYKVNYVQVNIVQYKKI